MGEVYGGLGQGRLWCSKLIPWTTCHFSCLWRAVPQLAVSPSISVSLGFSDSELCLRPWGLAEAACSGLDIGGLGVEVYLSMSQPSVCKRDSSYYRAGSS